MKTLIAKIRRNKKVDATIMIFIAAFFVGQLGAQVQHALVIPVFQKVQQKFLQGEARKNVGNAEEQKETGKVAVTVKTAGNTGQKEYSAVPASADGNWGLSFQEEGQKPVANATYEELSKYNAWYAQDTVDKIIYLTFDCGYENGNTPAILEALKKHEVPATFFVVGNFLTDNPDLAKQILAEGHTLGNHTMHHPDMSKMSDLASFEKEIRDLEETCLQVTGKEISKYYRPPQGKYSEGNLQMAQQLGYQTFFWSLAYVDWYENDQPTKEEAFEKLLGRIHPGAIVLLHNTSATNGAILDELLTKWEEMGYRFGKLEDLKNDGETDDSEAE